jgi:hypothetical protein
MLLLGIDIGTTNCKAGVFSTTGISVSMASTKTPLRGDRSGEYACDPQELWDTFRAPPDSPDPLAAQQSREWSYEPLLDDLPLPDPLLV